MLPESVEQHFKLYLDLFTDVNRVDKDSPDICRYIELTNPENDQEQHGMLFYTFRTNRCGDKHFHFHAVAVHNREFSDEIHDAEIPVEGDDPIEEMYRWADRANGAFFNHTQIKEEILQEAITYDLNPIRMGMPATRIA